MNKTSVIPYNVLSSLPNMDLTFGDTDNPLLIGKRVWCLYRVSTNQQVDHDEKNEADIPMQRKACHRFAEKMGWTIIHEEQEEGISGHKVRAENRDKLQLIKTAAKQKKFDILLVFMFDRIGRIADETPFVVEWFVKNGIQVWSVKEGEQRFDSHTDKLTNYIRFWQADGESEKTSIRTSTRMGQIVEDGFYTGGTCPYGYKLVRQGRVNKKGHELFDLVIDEDEAPLVRMIFEKYVEEGRGAQSIANLLNSLNIKNRSGHNWHPSSIRGMIKNITYIGILRSGESRSKVLPHLQIIDQQMFQAAQEITKQRSKSYEGIVQELEQKCAHLKEAYQAAQSESENAEKIMDEIQGTYNQFISWASIYDTASIQVKKMIVCQLIERVDVFRGYELKIKFSISVEQFLLGLNISA